MLNGWAEIGAFFESILLFVGNLLAGMVQLLEMMPKAITMLTTCIGSMPSVLVVFASGLVMVSVTYLIIGRM